MNLKLDKSEFQEFYKIACKLAGMFLKEKYENVNFEQKLSLIAMKDNIQAFVTRLPNRLTQVMQSNDKRKVSVKIKPGEAAALYLTFLHFYECENTYADTVFSMQMTQIHQYLTNHE